LFRDLEFTDQEPPVRAMLTSNEQFFLELMNAARLDPLGEAARQGIDLNAGLPNDKEGWKEIAPIPVQPLAPNAFIQQASADHGQWMLDTDTFSHTGAGGSSPGDRIVAAGYALTGQWTWGENLAIFNTTGNLDLGAVIKEGIGGFKGHFDGLYESPGHRVNIFEGAFRETGVAQVAGEFTAPDSEGIIRDWNASTITNKFGTTGTSVFLTGVIYDDTDTSGLYSVGEGGYRDGHMGRGRLHPRARQQPGGHGDAWHGRKRDAGNGRSVGRQRQARPDEWQPHPDLGRRGAGRWRDRGANAGRGG
jgi:hypothetical protein